jgi:methyl-accepting chemotaxis protein
MNLFNKVTIEKRLWFILIIYSVCSASIVIFLISKGTNEDIAFTSLEKMVEEQTATTSQMTQSISDAARGSSEIAETITGAAIAAKSTTEGAADTQSAACELSRMASELKNVVIAYQH